MPKLSIGIETLFKLKYKDGIRDMRTTIAKLKSKLDLNKSDDYNNSIFEEIKRIKSVFKALGYYPQSKQTTLKNIKELHYNGGRVETTLNKDGKYVYTCMGMNFKSYTLYEF